MFGFKKKQKNDDVMPEIFYKEYEGEIGLLDIIKDKANEINSKAKKWNDLRADVVDLGSGIGQIIYLRQ